VVSTTLDRVAVALAVVPVIVVGDVPLDWTVLPSLS
jgi:hypothetical protein